jgi:CRP/FNR family transcriptional regulator, cyclic AMP receptor protein
VSLIKNEVEILRKVPLFAGIEPSKLKLLAFTSDVVTYRPGQVLFKRGDSADFALIIIDGDADVTVPTENGDFKVAAMDKGDFVGEIAILCDTTRSATVTADTELKTLRIRRESFFELLHQFPEMAIEMARMMAERLVHTTSELIQEQKNKQSPA